LFRRGDIRTEAPVIGCRWGGKGAGAEMLFRVSPNPRNHSNAGIQEATLPERFSGRLELEKSASHPSGFVV